MTSEILHEARSLHPRIAYWLHANNWHFLHEYRFTAPNGYGLGIDFFAIHRVTGEAAIIEGKIHPTDVGNIASQLNRYHVSMGLAFAQKWAATLLPASNAQQKRFDKYGVKYLYIGEDTPMFKSPTGRKNFEEFNRLFVHFHHVGFYGPFNPAPKPFDWHADSLDNPARYVND